MKFHYSDLRSCVKFIITNTHKYLSLLFSVLIISIILIVFMPVRILSFGFMEKLSNYLINIQKIVLEHFIKKMSITLNC